MTQRKTALRKYLMVMSIVCVGSFVSAQSNLNLLRETKGESIIFKGHSFHWTHGGKDSVVTYTLSDGRKGAVYYDHYTEVDKMDNRAVWAADRREDVVFKSEPTDIHSYLDAAIKKAMPSDIDSIMSIVIFNVVVDTNGKIMYYDIKCSSKSKVIEGRTYFGYDDENLDPIVDSVIANCPPVKTLFKDGKAVPTYFYFLSGILFNKE